MGHAKQRRSAVHRAEYQYLLKRLRAARRQAGLTQVQVAKALGRPQSFVTKCELGERRIDPKSALVILQWESNGHNGGDLAFGPDGYLYHAAGDGTCRSFAPV